MKELLLMFVLVASAAQAQDKTESGPDVIVPDIAAFGSELSDERKFFLFHKPGTTFEQAFADLSFCYTHLPGGTEIALPSFVPWVVRPSDKGWQPAPNYGLVGAVTGALLRDRDYDAPSRLNMLRCMGPRGYARYRISRGYWVEINKAGPERSLAVQARIASGPVPSTPRIVP